MLKMLILYVHALKHKLAVLNIHLYGITYGYFAGKNLLTKRVFNPLLYCSAKRTGAVFGIESFVAYKLSRLVGNGQFYVSLL